MKKYNFNNSWRFFRGDIDGLTTVDYDASDLELVHLPHTARIEKANCSGGGNYQGILWYRKEFYLPENCEHKKLFLEFEGAKIAATVWINNVKTVEHFGGYLPFTVDLTNLCKDGINVVTVKLDNRDMPDVPPGKPQAELDFCYFGGLYRNVNFITCDYLHITDPIFADKVASGGVFVTYDEVTENVAKLFVKTHIKNEYSVEKSVAVRTTLVGGHCTNVSKTVITQDDNIFEQQLTVDNPRLWSIDEPNLYTLKSEVLCDGIVVDMVNTTIGIREINFDKNGFSLNGKNVKLSGANRHQEYVYVGDATTRSLHFRDAIKLKQCGFNCVRLGHYPQTVDFLDACDELGLVCIAPTPGWQWFRQNELFQNRSYQATAQLVRRDRNHPCIVLWEPILNETRYTEEFAVNAHNIVHMEYPTKQCFTACDWHKVGANVYDVLYGSDPKNVEEKAIFVREYGDNYREQFATQNTGKRVTRGKNSIYPYGGEAMLRSALERMVQLNRMYLHSQIAGAALWTGIDCNRGYIDNVATTGVLDLYRLPKFSYYMYQSQMCNKENPMIFIASFWDTPTDKLCVFSNCDEVKLYVNGKEIAVNKPDRAYLENEMSIKSASNLYESGNVLNEIQKDFVEKCAEGLPHPPFFFDNIIFEPGEIRGEGLINGVVVATQTVKTPITAVKIQLVADHCNIDLVADGADLMMIYAYIYDQNNSVMSAATKEITFYIEGEGALIGENPINAEAGIIGILVKATTNPGNIRVTAKSDGLIDGEIMIKSIESTEEKIAIPTQNITQNVMGKTYVYTADNAENTAKTSLDDYNIALHKPVIATSCQGEYASQNMTDGNHNTKWLAADGDPQLILIDLEKNFDVNGCKIWWENDNTDYTYCVKMSPDNVRWSVVVPTKVGTGQDVVSDAFWAEDMRYVAVEVEKVSKEVAGIFNILVYGM